MLELQYSYAASLVRMGLSTVSVRLAWVSFRLTVPPTPSQGLLPWLVAKKDQDANNSKSFL